MNNNLNNSDIMENSNQNNQNKNFELPKMETLDLNETLKTENQKPTVMQQNFKTNLPSAEEKSVAKENNALETRSEQNKQIEQFYNRQMDKEWGLWDRFTNNRMYQQVQQNKSELLQASSHYRLSFYKTVLDTQLEALTEKCNAGLKMIKAEYRQQVSSFVMQKLEQLAFEIKDRQISFLDMMKEKYKYSETLENYPSMRNTYMEKIFAEEGNYLNLLEALMNKFGSLVSEELKKY
jgi:hypothetical protein